MAQKFKNKHGKLLAPPPNFCPPFDEDFYWAKILTSDHNVLFLRAFCSNPYAQERRK